MVQYSTSSSNNAVGGKLNAEAIFQSVQIDGDTRPRSKRESIDLETPHRRASSPPDRPTAERSALTRRPMATTKRGAVVSGVCASARAEAGTHGGLAVGSGDAARRMARTLTSALQLYYYQFGQWCDLMSGALSAALTY